MIDQVYTAEPTSFIHTTRSVTNFCHHNSGGVKPNILHARDRMSLNTPVLDQAVVQGLGNLGGVCRLPAFLPATYQSVPQNSICHSEIVVTVVPLEACWALQHHLTHHESHQEQSGCGKLQCYNMQQAHGQACS